MSGFVLSALVFLIVKYFKYEVFYYSKNKTQLNVFYIMGACDPAVKIK